MQVPALPLAASCESADSDFEIPLSHSTVLISRCLPESLTSSLCFYFFWLPELFSSLPLFIFESALSFTLLAHYFLPSSTLVFTSLHHQTSLLQRLTFFGY